MGIDFEKFADDLEDFNDKVNVFVMENKYTKKYLDKMEIDTDFDDNRLEEFVNNGGFESKYELLDNTSLYNLMLGKTDILEIMELPLYDDLRDEDYIVDEMDFDRVEDKFMEFKSLNQKELLDELNRFANEATKYVKDNKIKFDETYNEICIK